MKDFLQDWLGESWRSALMGIVLIGLSMACGMIGGVFTLWEATNQLGVIMISQAVLMVPAGIGFLMTRDNAASKAAVRKIEAADRQGQMAHAENVQQIAQVKETVQEVKQTVTGTAAEVATEVAAKVAAQTVKESR